MLLHGGDFCFELLSRKGFTPRPDDRSDGAKRAK